MVAARRSLLIFLMGLAWRCRFSMPLLLSGTLALLGRTWMFHIRFQAVHRIDDREVAYFDENYDYDPFDDPDDEMSWDLESNDSWETIVEEVAYG